MENNEEKNNEIIKAQEIIKGEAKNNKFIVKNIIPRKNPSVYTQGLILKREKEKNYLYESGGLYEQSTLTKMEWPSQTIMQKLFLDEKYFGEGISFNQNNDKLYQLTWKEKVILEYDNNNNQLIFKDYIPLPKEINEGWGLCEGLDSEFYLTDGTDIIYILEIKNNLFEIKNHINIKYEHIKIDNINDLVFVNNYIWANRYYDDSIFKINPKNGKIENTYSMQPLIEYELNTGKLTHNLLDDGYVLNGITFNNINNTFIITGKMWDNYYEIQFIED
jgi:glutamine cyclotransferase